MKVVPLTQDRYCFVDDADYESVMRWRWHVQIKKEYPDDWKAARNVRDTKMKKMTIIFMSRFLLDPPAGMEVDHINGKPYDNQRKNLRICTHQENSRNRGVRKESMSGFKGVSFHSDHKRRKPWCAYIGVEGKLNYLGHYETKEEAARAYNKAAKRMFGEFARLNEV